MPERKKAFLLLGMLLLLLPLSAEIRGIWILPWGANTPAKIDAFLADAEAARQTDIFIEARYRADALYQTNRVPDEFPNPEPVSYLLNGTSFDPLAYALAEGHKRNLRVHAWFVALQATPVDSLRVASNYIFRSYPDWITSDAAGNRMAITSDNGYFVDPGVPEVQDYLLNIVGDLLSGYPELDGLQLDYIRYASAGTGYHPVSRFRYQADSRKLTWNQWRCEQVTSIVTRVRELTKKLNPNLILSAAVLADYPLAVKDYGQDWKDWLDRGLVDYVYPMAYAAQESDFARQLSISAGMKHPERIVLGLRAWNNDGSSLLPSDNPGQFDIFAIARRIGQARERGFAGVSLFSYNGLTGGAALQHLARLAFSEQTVAALAHAEYQPSPGARSQFPADITLSGSQGSYILSLLIPFEGKWTLELRDSEGQLRYERLRYYLRGLNQDYWNGVVTSGERIPAGEYRLAVYRAQDDFEYVIPVRLEELQR